MPFGVPSGRVCIILYGYNEHVMKKQNGVEENFQVVYLQNRKVSEGIKLLFIFY